MMSLFEIGMYFFGYNIFKAKKELKKINNFGNEELLEWKNKAKWDIAKYHYENNQLYNKKVGKIFPSRWEDLPIMEKSDFQTNDKVFSNDFNKDNSYFSWTSGSSGTPFFFAKSKYAHAMTWAFINYNYNIHKIKINSKQARFFGLTSSSRFKRIKENIKDIILNRVRFPVQTISEDNFDLIVKKFKNNKFDFLYGYANTLKLFAFLCIKNRLILKDICPTLKVCISTSEMLTNEHREIMFKGFGINIVDEYGSSETNIIAFENQLGEFVLADKVSHIETLIKNDFEGNKNDGSLIVTDYFNKSMPFIRYNVGDIVSISKDNIKKTDKRILNKILGRQNDVIVLSNGKSFPGFRIIKAIDYYISENFSDYNAYLKKFMVTQTHIDEFLLEIIIDRKLRDKEIINLEKIIKDQLNSKVRVIIKRVKSIRRFKSGKIKQFYSLIDSTST